MHGDETEILQIYAFAFLPMEAVGLSWLTRLYKHRIEFWGGASILADWGGGSYL